MLGVDLAIRRMPSELPFCGGDDGTRTHDPLRAKQVLSPLSYVPWQGRYHPGPILSASSGTGHRLTAPVVPLTVVGIRRGEDVTGARKRGRSVVLSPALAG